MLGWLHITFGQHGVSTLAEATLVVVLFTDASRIDLLKEIKELQLQVFELQNSAHTPVK